MLIVEGHNPIWEAIRSGIVGIVAGGGLFRYLRIAAQTMPRPVDATHIMWKWGYDFVQNAFDNQELRGK